MKPLETTMADTHRLAPRCVVRAAAWPIEDLLALAHDAPPAANAISAKSEAQDEVDHQAALDGQAALLWRMTLGEPAFRRALALANPSLYARIRNTRAPRGVWNKRDRQLAASLYQHWARACWRTEPCGLWAGVGLIEWAEASSQISQTLRCAITPDLRPWVGIFNALLRTPAYRDAGLFALNPSLIRDEAGLWHCRPGQPASGQVRSFNAEPMLDAAIELLRGLGPTGLEEAEQALVATLAVSSAQAQAQLTRLRSLGVLQGGLRFPTSYETVWQALESAAVYLQAAHAQSWRECVVRTRERCDALAAMLSNGNGDGDVVLAQQHAVLSDVNELARDCGVPLPEAPRAPLCCDAGLPWRVTLGRAEQARLRAAIAQIDAFQTENDPQAAYDRSYAENLIDPRRRRTPPPRVTHWEALADAPETSPGLRTSLRRWPSALRSGRLVTVPEQPDVGFTRPPFGTLALRLGSRDWRYVGLSQEPAIGFARFGELFGARHALRRWCEQALQHLQTTGGVRVAQVVAACESAPNLLAQPKLAGLATLDLYGTDQESLNARGLRFEGSRWRAHLRCAGEPAPVLAVFLSPLNLGAHDALLERLLLTGWRVMPGGFAASQLPFADELSQPGGTRAVALPSDVVLRPRRVVVSAAACTRLATAAPATRYALWRQWAHAWALPALVTVAREGEPPVALVRDSALAVEALLRAPGRPYSRLVIEVPVDDGYLTDDQGRRYATEIAVPFERRDHVWRAPPASVATVRPEAAEPRNVNVNVNDALVGA